MPVPHPASGAPAQLSAQDEVVQICRDLIRIDTSNYGDDSGPGERAAAEHVMGLLTEVGLLNTGKLYLSAMCEFDTLESLNFALPDLQIALLLVVPNVLKIAV
jgi:hypothetical protein